MHSKDYEEIIERAKNLVPAELIDLIAWLNERKAAQPKRSLESFRNGVVHEGMGSTEWVEDLRGSWDR